MNDEFENALRVALGIEADQRLESVVQEESPIVGVARGLSAETDTAALHLAIARDCRFQKIAVPSRLAGVLNLHRWMRDPRVLRLQAKTEDVQCSMRVGAFGELAWLLDGRGALAGITLDTPRGKFAIGTLNGELGVLQFGDPQLLVPSLEYLLEGFIVPSWLRQEAQYHLDSPAAFDRATGVGLCARFGAASTSDASTTLQRLLDGADSPATRMRVWARSLESIALGNLSQDIVTEVDALHEMLRGLRELVAHESRSTADAVRSLCLRRDDVECVGDVLRAAGRGDAASIVEPVDALASVARGLFTDAGPIAPNERLQAVHLIDPDAWWGLAP